MSNYYNPQNETNQIADGPSIKPVDFSMVDELVESFLQPRMLMTDQVMNQWCWLFNITG